ncbi:MAG: biotin synthase BioB, partial [Phycisphaerales bacterium]|nr:biotin synthase BioB [Phycisphaerales bacterium]
MHVNWNDVAEHVVAGGTITRDDARAILAVDDLEILELTAAAFRVRRHFFGTAVKLNYLVNAKSGACPEDCNYCSQSKISTADIEKYRLMSTDDIVAGARRAAQLKASTCCIVLSGRGPNRFEVDRVAEATRTIKEEFPDLRIFACMGLLRDDQAEALREAGVDRYNHNINTNADNYASICSTHTYDDRVDTVRTSARAGLSPCSGVIVGMGETAEDLVDMAFELRAIGAHSIPVNFLLPIEGTPLETAPQPMTPRDCLRTLALFRFVCPDAELRVSAGREPHLRTLQPMSLYIANALFIADYLTTEGQSPRLDWQTIEDLGFTIEPMGGGAGDASGEASERNAKRDRHHDWRHERREQRRAFVYAG